MVRSSLTTGLDGLGVRRRGKSFLPSSVFCAARKLEQKCYWKTSGSTGITWSSITLGAAKRTWYFLNIQCSTGVFLDPPNFQTIPCLLWMFTCAAWFSTLKLSWWKRMPNSPVMPRKKGRISKAGDTTPVPPPALMAKFVLNELIHLHNPSN